MRNFHPGKHRRQGLGLNSLTNDELFDIHLALLSPGLVFYKMYHHLNDFLFVFTFE